jgi:SAM-dependent methyltransferase
MRQQALLRPAAIDGPDRPALYRESFIDVLFGSRYELLPQVSQRYEIDLAYGETQSLPDDELVKRSAYLYRVDGRITHHFKICQHRPVQVDPDLKHRQNFFDANAFGVGYATHGLFPYRGKFHPQMIKGIMNIIGLRPGDTVLDPMAGSGTTLIEASIIGVNSIGVELSPFACLMARAKLAGLRMDCSGFVKLLEIADRVFDYFDREGRNVGTLFDEPEPNGCPVALKELEGSEARKELVLLAFLDAMGYATRRKSKQAKELFPTVLARYLAAVQQFNVVREELDLVLGKSKVLCGDCRALDLPDQSVDGVLFSPPYSFAIDYVANDDLQLKYLGLDPAGLSARMVGLVGGQGRTISERIRNRVGHYFEDMEKIIAECARVMKPGACCVIVIGSNTNQTGGIRLEQKMIEFAQTHGMPVHKIITREIEGIRNTMREEFILIFRKN